MAECLDGCKGNGACATQPSPMVTPRGSVFQQQTMTEERAAMDELSLLDHRIADFYGQTIRAHTLAAGGSISGADLEEKILHITSEGDELVKRLHAFAGRIKDSMHATREHLIGHLPAREESHEKQ